MLPGERAKLNSNRIPDGTVAGLADHPTLQKTAELIDVASGYTDNGIVHQGRLDPGVLLLSKPYRKSHLAKMIRQALG